MFFEGIDPSEDAVKFDVNIKEGLPEGLLKVGLGNDYFYVWDITSIAPSAGLRTVGWITKTCPIREFIQDGTGRILTDLEEARSRYSMVWTSRDSVDVHISIDNVRFASSSSSVATGDLFLDHVDLYPNPFSNTLTIDATQQVEKVTAIQVFDLSGALITTIGANKDITTVDMRDMDGGMYFIILSLSGGKYVVKKMLRR